MIQVFVCEWPIYLVSDQKNTDSLANTLANTLDNTLANTLENTLANTLANTQHGLHLEST